MKWNVVPIEERFIFAYKISVGSKLNKKFDDLWMILIG